MNILIPYSWLKEYLKTNASVKKIAECLSLCGPSVERIKKIKDDFVYEIEITSNRVDTASVFGIAREAKAILPQFGWQAKIKINPLEFYQKKSSSYPISQEIKELKVKIQSFELCPRFSAVLIEGVKVKPSPKIIAQRLKAAGMRPLNNIIDISNYLMLELGQPVHVFDYDKISGQTMILRLSQKGERITTLDGKSRLLPGNDIIIEDGKKRIIDLCGIMGGLNSAIDEKTKKVLLFVQNYQPEKIRKTAMKLAHHTAAASLFEKGVDPELVMPTLIKGIEMIEKYASGKIASHILDIYPSSYKEKSVKVSLQLIRQYLGIPIKLNNVLKILKSLDFKIKNIQKENLEIGIPSWRANDIKEGADIIEEIARLYGYHRLPNLLPAGELPSIVGAQNFKLETEVKKTLADWGYTETYTYSMQSRAQLEKANLNPEKHLKISNPLTDEWVYLRTSLIPSLLSVLKQNQELKKTIKVFELAKTYFKNENQPKEKLKLVIINYGNNQFLKLKGIIEALFIKFNLKNYQLLPAKNLKIFNPFKTTKIESNLKTIGYLGYLKSEVIKNFSLEKPVVCCQIDFENFSSSLDIHKTFNPILSYPPVIEDLTFIVKPNVYVGKIMETIKKTSPLIKEIKLVNFYKNNFTFRIIYQSPHKNLSGDQVAQLRKKIVKKIKLKGWAILKQKEKD